MKVELEVRFKELRVVADKLLDLQYTHLSDVINEIDNIYDDLDRAICEVENEVENLEAEE